MHLFSTLFTAQTVDQEFRGEEGLATAIAWCRASGLHKVYIESYRDGTFIEESLLKECRDRFLSEGFLVDGCVTTTALPKVSPGPNRTGCYSDEATCRRIEEIFRRTARVFDTIMIDDFLFMTCTCEECEKARGGRSFGDYHSDIMHEMSVRNILRPCHEENPKCRVIIKYPLWYENFHQNGYDVLRQTRDFDLIWAGTETREPDSARWGRYPQTQGFYMMAWDIRLNPEKCLGGWYDPLDTSPVSYLDQARQTILGKAPESMLFCYSALAHSHPGIEDTEAWRRERPGLVELAYLVENRSIRGISVPKQPDCDAAEEKYLSSFYGMLGLPVDPDISLNNNAPSVILGTQASHYPGVRDYVFSCLEKGIPVACSAGFVRYTGLDASSFPIIDPNGDNWNLMAMPQSELNALRDSLMKPLGVALRAPVRVALNLYDDDLEVLQNFNDQDADVTLDLFARNPKARQAVLLLGQKDGFRMERDGTCYRIHLPARTLAVLA